MKILFLDQSGKLGGAELSLLDVARVYQQDCLVGLLADGPFRQLLQQHHIPVQVLTQQIINVNRTDRLFRGLRNFRQLIPLIAQVTQLSRNFDLIYANTPKALVVGAIASYFSRRRLVYHLRDILSPEHFSATNRQMMVTLANHRATCVIANSQATASAFIQAGGRSDLVQVVYNGFEPERYQLPIAEVNTVRQAFELSASFVVGHFSRLSPWKGQHVLIEALTYCPEEVVAILVGDALFGEQAYVEQLHQQIERLGLSHRVRFLGFQSEIPPLMQACDLIAHTSTAPEPFGRVIVEGMLCGRPVVAAAAGGAVELIEPGTTGWLSPPGDAAKLAEIILECRNHPDRSQAIAQRGRQQASDRFNLRTIQKQLDDLLKQVV